MTRIIAIAPVVVAIAASCIAGFGFAWVGVPTPGAIILGAAVFALLAIIHAAMWYADRK